MKEGRSEKERRLDRTLKIPRTATQHPLFPAAGSRQFSCLLSYWRLTLSPAIKKPYEKTSRQI